MPRYHNTQNFREAQRDLAWLQEQENCPRCGAEGRIVEVRFDDGDIWYRPECSCCGIGWQENYQTVREAVCHWNKSTDAGNKEGD